jgi:hypothetical protein
MSLKKTMLVKVLGFGLGAFLCMCTYAADSVVEGATEAAVPKESMFQAGKSYIVRLSDQLLIPLPASQTS